MKTSILIVDDEVDLRERVKLVLGSVKYELTEAGDLAGLRRALAGPAPDVVILDLRLPDGNSLSALPELKQKWPASKVIILTGHGTVEVAEEAYKVDPQLFLQSKPFDPGTLRALVELALAGKPDRATTTDRHK
jgi:DNA-binding NtrC family response regulator